MSILNESSQFQSEIKKKTYITWTYLLFTTSLYSNLVGTNVANVWVQPLHQNKILVPSIVTSTNQRQEMFLHPQILPTNKSNRLEEKVLPVCHKETPGFHSHYTSKGHAWVTMK